MKISQYEKNKLICVECFVKWEKKNKQHYSCMLWWKFHDVIRKINKSLDMSQNELFSDVEQKINKQQKEMSWKTDAQKIKKYLFQMLIQKNFKNKSQTKRMLWWSRQKCKQRDDVMNNMWCNHRNIMQSSVRIL